MMDKYRIRNLLIAPISTLTVVHRWLLAGLVVIHAFGRPADGVTLLVRQANIAYDVSRRSGEKYRSNARLLEITRGYTLALVTVVAVLLVFSVLFAAQAHSVTSLQAPKTIVSDAIVLENLALYVSRGQDVRWCHVEWHQASTMRCTAVTDLQSLIGMGSLLGGGDYVSVAFDRRTLSAAELLAHWGTPRIVSDRRNNRVSLEWDLSPANMTGWLSWEDRHEVPETAELTLSVTK